MSAVLVWLPLLPVVVMLIAALCMLGGTIREVFGTDRW